MESLHIVDIGLIAIFATIIIGKLLGCKLRYSDPRDIRWREQMEITANPNHPLNPAYKSDLEKQIAREIGIISD